MGQKSVKSSVFQFAQQTLLNSVGACYDKATSLLDDYFDEHSVLTLINDTWNSDLPEDFFR